MVSLSFLGNRCILSKFYIKPQRWIKKYNESISCILSKFYIKPQLAALKAANSPALYLIEILHQTTTRTSYSCTILGCILSKFYIKPQQEASTFFFVLGCILSKFYIKPQLPLYVSDRIGVVSYRNSTSNHNGGKQQFEREVVVSYRNSTSNHNFDLEISFVAIVVSYRNSTSNHN